MLGGELDNISKAFHSNWIAPIGPQIDSFEEKLSKYIGVKYGCALSSGTAALHLALKVIGVKKGDFVLCPSLTFAASANVILYENAIPVFVDVDLDYFTIDLTQLEKAILKYKPKALIAVDLYGQSCDYDSIVDLCNNNNVFIIEDAAEALGSKYKQKKCGSFGQIGILSFNGNKIITTSGGGILLSDNEDYTSEARFLSTQAKEPQIHYEHRELGYNYGMSNLLAALGIAQLNHLDQMIKIRQNIFSNYYNALSSIEGIEFMSQASFNNNNCWLTVLTINSTITGRNYLEIIEALEKENIESRPIWKPMHMQPLYKDYDYIVSKEQDNSKVLFENGICLPSGSSLHQKDQDKILDIILNCIKN